MDAPRNKCRPSPPQNFPNIANYNDNEGTITDYCTTRGFPMGGIGTGGFNVLTDGGFGKFRTNHNWFQIFGALDYPKGTFLAIRCNQSGEKSSISRILRRSYQGGAEFENIRPIAHTKFFGQIPRFSLEYSDQDMPITTKLSGFTALIPHNPKDSSLPAVNFTITVKNPTEGACEAAVLFSFENLLGLGGSGGSPFLLRDGPVKYKKTKGNYAIPFESGRSTGIEFKTAQQYPKKDPRQRVIGTYYLVTEKIGPNPQEGRNRAHIKQISRCYAWSSREKRPHILEDFSSSGTILAEYQGKSPNAGAISIKLSLPPSSEISINFAIVWWTPYYVLEKHQRVHKIVGHHHGIDFGHYYLNYFRQPMELIDYNFSKRKELAEASSQLERILSKSTLPTWLQRYVLNSADAVLVNTCLTKEGDLFTIEGCPWDWPFGGLTGTLDQRLASHPYTATFFPALDLTELETFRRLTLDGEVPHGNGHCDVMLYSTDVPYGMPLKIYNKTKVWTDLPQSYILQIAKYILNSGNIALLREIWPELRKMMGFLGQASADGIPDGITTYDYAYYRPHFIYSAGLQLATLESLLFLGKQLLTNQGVEIKITEREASAIKKDLERYRRQYELCRQSMETRLWTEKGFYKTCSPKNTVFVAALAGDWAARNLGLSPVFSFDKAQSHAVWQKKLLVDSHSSINKYGKISRPLVYREADLDGKEILVKDNMFIKERQVNNPWQVLAYMAFEWIYLGKTAEGLAVIKRIWEKGYYEGYPWDMDHWGFPGHIYMTHPAMWAVFNALTGASLDLLSHVLVVSPKLPENQDNMRIPVFFPVVWLWIEFSGVDHMLKLEIIKGIESSAYIEKLRWTSLETHEKEIKLDQNWFFTPGNQITVPSPFKNL